MAAVGFPAPQRARLAWLTEQRCPNDAAARAVCLADGIGVRHIGRAIARRPLSAEPHLALCAALGVDPVTLLALGGLARPPRPIAGPIAWWHLAVGLVIRREVDGVALRAAAARVQVSPATFVRAEAGRVVSTDAFFRLCAFLGLHPHDVTARDDARPAAVAARNLGQKPDCFTGHKQ